MLPDVVLSVLLWPASAMVAISVLLAAWAVFGDRPSGQRASRVLAGHAPTMRETVLQRSAVERMVVPVTRSVGGRLLHLTPIGWVERRSRALAKAGLSGRVTPEQILGAKLLLPTVFGGLLGLRLVAGGDSALTALLLAGVVVAFFAPDILLRAVADRRAEALTRSLPDVLDQVTISVEAGLDFEAALARTSSGQDHPLAQECLRMLQDVRLGASRADALGAMADRTQVDDLRSVVLSLRQADSLGAPLSKTLRNLSNEMREKRRFRAEARAQRLPTLMIFPLGLCILPALFIVVIGPVIVSGTAP